MASPITLNEIKTVLEGFSLSKIPGPNGWTIEFFLSFFDLVGWDLLVVAEESRHKGHVSGALNATFISLIPKCDNPKSFDNFCRIPLFNLVYKIISKVISN